MYNSFFRKRALISSVRSFAVGKVALAWCIAFTPSNYVEYAVFAVAHFLTEVPLLLGVAAICRWWRGSRRCNGPTWPGNKG